MNKLNIKKFFLLFLLIAVFLLLLSSVIFSIININNSNILNGISINYIDISNLSKEEATAVISKMIMEKEKNNIIISASENNQVITSFESLDINYSINSAINEAYNIGRSGNIFQNNFDIIKLFFNKKNIDLSFNVSQDKLNNLMESISSNIENKVIQSSYFIENNKLIITKGIDGYDLDKNEFINRLSKTLKNISSQQNYIEIPIVNRSSDTIDIEKIYSEIYKSAEDAYYEKNPLTIHPEVIGVSFDKELASKLILEDKEEYEIDLIYTYPKITLNDLDIDIFQNKLATFSTKYNISNTDRSTNLKLAASKINGTILSPLEEFSYNKIVGSRTIEAGYKEAKIYSNGEVVDGVGGGICQISSTLYNAVVLANLEVTQRHSHQFLTSYVDAGRDATVSYGSKDFKFKNTRTYPIKIDISVDKGVVTCTILGIKEDPEYEVEFDIETLYVTDPPIKYEQNESLSYGVEKVIQNGSKGMSVNVYKLVKLDGNIFSKTLLSQDTYNSLEKIILKNTP